MEMTDGPPPQIQVRCWRHTVSAGDTLCKMTQSTAALWVVHSGMCSTLVMPYQVLYEAVPGKTASPNCVASHHSGSLFPSPAQRTGKSKTPSSTGGGGGGKRQKRGKGAVDYASGQETEEEDEEAFLASVRGRGRCRMCFQGGSAHPLDSLIWLAGRAS